MIEILDSENRELTVTFDGRRINYDVTDLDELVQAYAITIHKSQGSEYPVVVMPVLMTHFVMLQRNLIYTDILILIILYHCRWFNRGSCHTLSRQNCEQDTERKGDILLFYNGKK